MPLVFAPAEIPATVVAERTDVACFIGFVHRRAGTALSAAQRMDLRDAGWIDGPWALPAARLDALEQVPVAVESWSEFDRLFDSVARPLSLDGDKRCAAVLGAAVRSFFIAGGRRAIIVRVGDPWPVLEPAPRDQAERDARAALVAGRLAVLLPLRTVDRFNPAAWQGLEHLIGLEQAALLCLPDLPLLHALPTPTPDGERPIVTSPEVFVECSVNDVGPVVDPGLRRIGAPRLDMAGTAAWAHAVGRVRDFLLRYRRDCGFVAALPLFEGSAGWQRHYVEDPLGALTEATLLRAAGTDAAQASSAFVQLATPWLESPSSQDLPQALMPPDGLLAGTLARNALTRGTFRSAAGTRRPEIIRGEPTPATSLVAEHPWSRLAERVCVFAPGPDGWALQSDVTSSPAPAWRGGQASRLVASVLRSSRALGQVHAFGLNGLALWRQARLSLEQLLMGYWRAGGLGGDTPEDAFEVRCDRTTMTQADLDAGRLIVEVVLLPAASVERITVSFSLLAAQHAEGSEAVLGEAVA